MCYRNHPNSNNNDCPHRNSCVPYISQVYPSTFYVSTPSNGFFAPVTHDETLVFSWNWRS